MKKNLLNSIIENVKTVFYALIIAGIIRSLFFQPFYIPSSSMEPTLLIGDNGLASSEESLHPETTRSSKTII